MPFASSTDCRPSSNPARKEESRRACSWRIAHFSQAGTTLCFWSSVGAAADLQLDMLTGQNFEQRLPMLLRPFYSFNKNLLH